MKVIDLFKPNKFGTVPAVWLPALGMLTLVDGYVLTHPTSDGSDLSTITADSEVRFHGCHEDIAVNMYQLVVEESFIWVKFLKPMTPYNVLEAHAIAGAL